MVSSDRLGHEGHFIEVDGLSVYHEVHGQGEPLLLLHAGTLSGRMWQPYLADLADRFRVIVPDMPNHGRSARPARALSYRQLADETVSFIQALDLVRPAIVGYSDGGQVALEIGVRYPTLPRSLALGGVLFRDNDGYRAFVRSALGDYDSPHADPAHLMRNHPDWAAWLDEMYGPGGWTALLESIKPMWTNPPHYTAKDLARVAAPVLVFVGDRDELVPVDEATEMYRQLPDAELAVIPDADHGAFFSSRVTGFQAVLSDHLRRHRA